MVRRLALAFLLASGVASAQLRQVGAHKVDGSDEWNLPHAATLPATCAVGDIYADSDAPSGARIYLCESANTWVAQGSGTVTTTGTLASGQVALGSGATSVTGDAGLSWTNTGVFRLLVNGADVGYDAATFQTRLGFGALPRATSTGTYNLGVGYLALAANTSGGSNMALGPLSMQANLSGVSNVAVGVSTLRASTVGDGNVAIGSTALQFLDGGSNVGIGASSGQVPAANAFWNTLVGAYADTDSATALNRTAIGYGAISKANYQVVLGNTAVTEVQLGGDGVAVGTAAGYRVLGVNGEIAKRGYSSELLTLSTGGTTTVTSASLVPASARITAITYRVTTTITTATDFTVKPTAGAAFATIGTATTAQTGLTATTTGTLVPVLHADQYSSAADTVTVTTTGTPGAGAMRLTVFYEQIVPGTS